MAGRGRPSKYKPEFAEQAKKLCLLGAIDTDLANFFDVIEPTINGWKRKYPEFAAALNEAKKEANAKVKRSLFERATGYSHPDDKVFISKGKTIIVPTTKHYPPDAKACEYWLNNRDPDNWKNMQTRALTGADGGPIQTEEVTRPKISKEEWLKAHGLG